MAGCDVLKLVNCLSEGCLGGWVGDGRIEERVLGFGKEKSCCMMVV